MSSNRDDVSAALNRAIGGRVAWYLKYAGDTRRTQAELADLLGVQQSAVSKKLAGHRPFLPSELYAIAEWLDRPLGDFLPMSAELSDPPSPRLGRDQAARNSYLSPGDTDRYVPSERALLASAVA